VLVRFWSASDVGTRPRQNIDDLHTLSDRASNPPPLLLVEALRYRA
jgi:hypothetical protein